MSDENKPISLGWTRTEKKCDKCGDFIIIRNSHRFPYDIIIECKNCKRRFKVVPS